MQTMNNFPHHTHSIHFSFPQTWMNLSHTHTHTHLHTYTYNMYAHTHTKSPFSSLGGCTVRTRWYRVRRLVMNDGKKGPKIALQIMKMLGQMQPHEYGEGCVATTPHLIALVRALIPSMRKKALRMRLTYSLGRYCKYKETESHNWWAIKKNT